MAGLTQINLLLAIMTDLGDPCEGSSSGGAKTMPICKHLEMRGNTRRIQRDGTTRQTSSTTCHKSYQSTVERKRPDSSEHCLLQGIRDLLEETRIASKNNDRFEDILETCVSRSRY